MCGAIPSQCDVCGEWYRIGTCRRCKDEIKYARYEVPEDRPEVGEE